MKPPPFDYAAPDTLAEALALLHEHGYGAKVLAGGQSLIATLNFRLAAPGMLIDLNNIPDLAYIRPGENGGLRVGAMTRHVSVEKSEAVAQHAPLVHSTMPFIAHPQIRNRGTFGGSLAHADPAAELPAILLALQGRVKAQSSGGERWIAADEFFTGLFSTALEPEEILTEVDLPPLPARTGWGVQEVSRRHGDFALVAAFAVVTLGNDDTCQQVRLSFCGVGEGPVLARQAMAVLQGTTLDEEAITEAAAIASTQDVDPPSDVHASSQFRRHLVKILGERALRQAAARAAGKEV